MRWGVTGGGRHRPAPSTPSPTRQPGVARYPRPGPAEVELLREVFGFHELALEDVTRPHERPRCDAYRQLLLHRGLWRGAAGDAIVPRELNLFWGRELPGDHPSRGQRGAGRTGGGSPSVGPHERRQTQGARVWPILCSRRRWRGISWCRIESKPIGAIEESIFKAMKVPPPICSGSGRSCSGCRRLLAPTSHVLAEVLRRDRPSRRGSSPISPTCRTTRSTYWPNWTA